MLARLTIRRLTLSLVSLVPFAICTASGQTPAQPKVAPGPGEPDWKVLLEERYGLSMFGDLKNPVETTAAKAIGRFRRSGPGEVTFTPLIALGLPSRSRCGWYRTGPDGLPVKRPLWTYTFKNTAEDLKADRNLPPPLEAGSVTRFDPGDGPFGLWASNDRFDDGGVFTEPAVVAAVNARLRKQPYKAMIYPVRDRTTGKDVPGSYLIGWEYSDNDDFQDIVCRIDNVILVK
ncbi:hypothetical protein [Aquisphaera insulae]|uniref:hypothetical protein n=1 Tax=Aquisphaera insulae TaxID=2712864 RepID=UPI0020303C7A|nr:hypothetical protein [Aquisphaera insulae]